MRSRNFSTSWNIVVSVNQGGDLYRQAFGAMYIYIDNHEVRNSGSVTHCNKAWVQGYII